MVFSVKPSGARRWYQKKRRFNPAYLWLALPLCVIGYLWNPPEKVRIVVDGHSSMTAEWYSPDTGHPSPAVILLHGCAGVMNKHRMWAKTLVDWGYSALLVDSFSERGWDRICAADDDVWRKFNKLRLRDLRASLAYLQSLSVVDAERISVMGWSYGGTIALAALDSALLKPDQSPGLQGGIVFYPGCWDFLQQKGKGQYLAGAPVTILQGEADDWTRYENCQQLLERSQDSVYPVSLQLYPEAYHDFDDPEQRVRTLSHVRIEKKQASGDVTIGFNREAYLLAKKAVKNFLTSLDHGE